MNRTAIDLPWHDVVCECCEAINVALASDNGIDSFSGLLGMTRDNLRAVLFQFDCTRKLPADDSVGEQLFDALSYLTEGLRLDGRGRDHLIQAHELLVTVRDLAIPY